MSSEVFCSRGPRSVQKIDLSVKLGLYADAILILLGEGPNSFLRFSLCMAWAHERNNRQIDFFCTLLPLCGQKAAATRVCPCIFSVVAAQSWLVAGSCRACRAAGRPSVQGKPIASQHSGQPKARRKPLSSSTCFTRCARARFWYRAPARR